MQRESLKIFGWDIISAIIWTILIIMIILFSGEKTPFIYNQF